MDPQTPRTAGHAPPSNHSTDVDVDDIVRKNKCAAQYLDLEKCLVATNRSWKDCQREVSAKPF